jgi:hypothetical protein
MKKVLYVNHGISKKCGVYDLGLRHFLSIKDIDDCDIKYEEIDSIDKYFKICELEKPEIIIFNYMPITCSWLNETINNYKCVKICVPHLFTNGDIRSFRNNIFDYYIVLDKNSISDKICFKTNRPLTVFKSVKKDKNKIPTIGSFGFAFTYKFFNRIVKHVNDCFDEAIINFYMSKPHFNNGRDETQLVIDSCVQEIKKTNIQLNVTTDFLNELEIIEKLNENDINCLFYHESQNIGISSSLDYLVSAQKPILISDSNMFRSFSSDLPIYPNISMREIYQNFDIYHEKAIKIYEDSINKIKDETKNILNYVVA